MFAVCISQASCLISPLHTRSDPNDFDSHSYRFAHISHTIRALQSSTKTSLRIEAEGLLSLQFLVPVPKARGGGTSDSFIEFRVCMVGASGDLLSRASSVYAIGRRSRVSRTYTTCLRGRDDLISRMATRQTVNHAQNSKACIKLKNSKIGQNRPSK